MKMGPPVKFEFQLKDGQFFFFFYFLAHVPNTIFLKFEFNWESNSSIIVFYLATLI